MIKLGLDKPPNLSVREPLAPKLVDELSRQTGGSASPSAPSLQIVTYGDERSRALSEFDHTFAV